MRAGPERDHFQTYIGRIKSWPVTVREIDPRRPARSADKRRAWEGKAILDAIAPDAVPIALDQTGRQLGSASLAARLRAWQDEGQGQIAFSIGGADGLDAKVIEQARLTLSLGLYTWPHMLARIMLAEQIYRAQQIIANHPYHRA